MIRSDIIAMAVAVVVVVFAVAGMGCASGRVGGAAAGATFATAPNPKKSTDKICFTRVEIARIQAFKIRCRARIKELRAKAKHDLATAHNQHKAALAQCQIRLKGCYDQATIKHTCPSCVRPAIVVGIIAGGVGLIAGVVGGVLVTLAIQGEIP